MIVEVYSLMQYWSYVLKSLDLSFAVYDVEASTMVRCLFEVLKSVDLKKLS